jgi:hypothetical protein
MDAYILGNGKMEKGMDEEYKIGQTGQGIAEIGKTIKLMEKGNWHMLMGMYMMEIGWMIWHVDMEYIHIQMERYMKDIGLLISNMDLEKNNGLMELCIKAHLIWVIKVVKEYYILLMAQHMKENL